VIAYPMLYSVWKQVAIVMLATVSITTTAQIIPLYSPDGANMHTI